MVGPLYERFEDSASLFYGLVTFVLIVFFEEEYLRLVGSNWVESDARIAVQLGLSSVTLSEVFK